MWCDVVIAKTQSESLPPERGKVRMGVGLTRSQDPPSSPRLRMGVKTHRPVTPAQIARRTELLRLRGERERAQFYGNDFRSPPTLALPLKWLLKKWLKPAASSFPPSTPLEWSHAGMTKERASVIFSTTS